MYWGERARGPGAIDRVAVSLGCLSQSTNKFLPALFPVAVGA